MQGKLFDLLPATSEAAEGTDEETVQNLLAAWIDRVRELTRLSPPKQTIGRMAAQIRDLVKTHPPTLVRTALMQCADAGLPPSWLPERVLRAQVQPQQSVVQQWIKERGWPTGVRYQRGTHGGTYVADPLGYDRPPPSLRFSPPTRAQLQEALSGLLEKKVGEDAC